MRRTFTSSLIAIILIFSLACPAFAEDVLYYHTDVAGTPLAITNSSGAKVWEADYMPFGEEYAVSSTTENDRRFVGNEKDEETGFNYFGARYFSSEQGRFLATDPITPVDAYSGKPNVTLLTEPQRLNVYAYSLNNPYRYTDPDGEMALQLLFGGALFAATIFAGSHHMSQHYQEMVSSAERLADLGNGIWQTLNEDNEHNNEESPPSATDANFPDKKELAKKLGLKNTKEIHDVKNEVKVDHPREWKKLKGDNHDLGYKRDGTLVLKSRVDGKTSVTDGNIGSYKRD